MKKLFFILGLILFLSPICQAKKVVVLEVSREGKGWQNFFNCYERVTTEFVSIEDGITYANLRCEGAGYNYCRVSREIGEISSTASNESHLILTNTQIVDAINDLIEMSEHAFSLGTTKGSNSKKVAIVNSTKTNLYLINAAWQYSDRKSSNPGNGKLVITIQLDDQILPIRRNN